MSLDEKIRRKQLKVIIKIIKVEVLVVPKQFKN